MDPVRVDENGSVRLKLLVPGAYYEPEVVSSDEIKLRRVYPRVATKMSRADVLKAIEQSELSFSTTWDALRMETRE